MPEIVDQVIQYVLMMLPTFTSIIAVVTSTITSIKNFKAIKNEIVDDRRYKKLEEQMAIVIEENYRLQQDLAALIEAQQKREYEREENIPIE